MANCYVTCIAPTGTISFMMDATTTGMEPEMALVKFKSLVGGEIIKIVNDTVAISLERLGYSHQNVEEIKAYILEHKTIKGAPYVPHEHYPIFQCSSGTRSP